MAKGSNPSNRNVYIWLGLLVMVVLFFSSSQTYEQQSQISFLSRILAGQPFAESLSGIQFNYAGSPVSMETKGYFGFVEFFIRKGAHFLTYFVLGGAGFLGLQYRINQVALTGLVSWLAATGYAALDEYHQMITGGRSPLFQDVMLDSIGAGTAIVLCIIIIFWRRR